MGRAAEFDRDSVLTGAMEAFRRSGYAAVSIKTLEAETGLKSGSIYHAFGDKAGLFQAAFEHYLTHVLDDRIETYASADKGLKGLKALFLTLLNEPGGGSFGCLITNSAVEFAADAVPGGVAVGLRRLHRLFEERLRAAQASGTARSIPPSAGAARLLALYQGILVLVRAGWEKRRLREMIEAEFEMLKRTER